MFRPRWAAIVTTTMYLQNVFEPSASFNKKCLSFSHKLLYLPISSTKTYQEVKIKENFRYYKPINSPSQTIQYKERSGHRIVIAQTSALTKRVTGSLSQLIAQPTIDVMLRLEQLRRLVYISTGHL